MLQNRIPSLTLPVVVRSLWPLVAFALLAAPARASTPAGASRAGFGSSAGLLHPSDVTVTVGALFPGFLIYEYPAPWAGVELGWRTSAHTRVVANAGLSVIRADGSIRVFGPLGISLRAFPWENGPWGQIGIGTIPWVERFGVVLPERTANATDFGATLSAKVQLGFRLWGWDLGLGTDFNLLPKFYKQYTGNESLPWSNTVMVWVGRQVWTRSPL